MIEFVLRIKGFLEAIEKLSGYFELFEKLSGSKEPLEPPPTRPLVTFMYEPLVNGVFLESCSGNT